MRLALLLALGGLLNAQEAPTYTEAEADSIREAQRNFRSGQSRAWEPVLSAPGKLIFLPIKLVGETIEATTEVISERQVIPKTIDLLTSEDGRKSLFPVYKSQTGAGLKYSHKRFFGTQGRFSATATAWLRNRQRYQMRFRNMPVAGGMVGDLIVRYQFLADEEFYGIGNSATESDRLNYAHEDMMAEAGFGLNIGESVETRLVVGIERNNILPGRATTSPSIETVYQNGFADPLDPGRVPLTGFQSGVQFVTYGLEVRRDSRNHPGQPTAGRVSLLRAAVFQEAGGKGDDRFGFYRLTLDVAQNLHLFYNRVLQVRVAGEMARGFDGRTIPFYYLSEIGRQETVRGFRRGRFRDRDMVMGSLEYRYPVWEIADVFLFADGGQVASSITDEFDFGEFQFGYGGGVRVWGAGGVYSSLAVANSDDGLRLYFGLNQEL